jgi:hypothetical protein
MPALPPPSGPLFTNWLTGTPIPITFPTVLPAVGGGTFTPTDNYLASNLTTLTQFLDGSRTTPQTSADAISIINKVSNFGSNGNYALYVGHIKRNSAAGVNASAVGIFSETQDEGGGTTAFVEGGRFHAILQAGNSSSAYGAIFFAANVAPNTFTYLTGCEAQVANNAAADAPLPASFSSGSFAAAFVATCGKGGTKKGDAGFIVNPFNTPTTFRTGFFVPNNSVDYAAFCSSAVCNLGLDLSLGTFSVAAVQIPNNQPIAATNAAGNAVINGLLLDGSNIWQLGGGNSVNIAADLYTNDASFLIRTKTTLTNFAAAQTATLTNSPTAGNPTKWFHFDDNGTTRAIPAW